ncbi:serine/threonine-protein kinase [Calothrix sp. PCC 7507]|uniref:serine/threonine protein kinase n=1 Tax=Calothrix sp. PCC 7507 TaxID=99598 RepID=UPI00029F4021|nr:serine/threonine-protein kinase [Calothrix sp. PCC 7507]AFY36119.1 serine/threonine protein kinase [Calothrix sp. PCC 7507]
MSICINPVCPQPNQSDQDENRFCQSCGSQLELQGRYRVMRLLSENTGFSKVYEVYEKDTPKILKVLKEDLSEDAKAVELFQQEVAVLAQLKHPGIPQVDGYFQYQTRNGLVLHCIVMEKIDGLNLEQWLQQQEYKPISQVQAIAWLRQLVEILDLLHSQQYLHRDIKPSNIMVRSPLVQEDGENLVLIDFGTAGEITSGTTPIMSSGYSAVEQMSGEAVPQSDFYALGRTFVFLLTGRHPLDMCDIQQNVLHWRNHATHISPLLLDLIDWLMASEIDNRPANAQEILQHLAEITQQPTANTGELPPPINQTLLPQKKPRKKLPLLALLAALIVSLGLIILAAFAMRSLKFIPTINYGQSPARKGKVDYFSYIEGKDSKGKIAEFNIAVLSVEYKWLPGSNFQIKYNDKVISLDLLKLNLEQEGIQKIMEEPSEIISVGTASCEGKIAFEQRRALERSRQVKKLAKKLFNNTSSVKNYRLLNLGRFQRSDCQSNQDSTAYQRSIMIIGVRKKSAGVILDEALRDRLEKKPFADFKLEDYSLGSVEKFKTITSNL